MNILVIEDEKKLAKQLCDCINRFDPSLQIVQIISTVRESVEWLGTNTPDLIFMDIKLADGSCFDIFDVIKVESPVVFCTAFDDYAIKAFENNGIAYILKPVTDESVALAFRKIYSFLKLGMPENQQQVIRDMKSPERRRFFILVGTKLLSIQTEEISHFYASDKIVFLVDLKGNKYIINYTLEYLDNILPKKDFFRINRKFIISYQTISRMSMYGMNRVKILPKVATAEEMIVSVDRTSRFKLWLDGLLAD
jgi:two-component system response regulator LytT